MRNTCNIVIIVIIVLLSASDLAWASYKDDWLQPSEDEGTHLGFGGFLLGAASLIVCALVGNIVLNIIIERRMKLDFTDVSGEGCFFQIIVGIITVVAIFFILSGILTLL